MKTKIPSDVVGSPSARAAASCRKKPYCVAPADVRARVFWVTTPRTKYWRLDELLPVSGASAERWAGPTSRSDTEPCTWETRRTGCTETVVAQVPVCGIPSAFEAPICTAYVPCGVAASITRVAVAEAPTEGAGTTLVTVTPAVAGLTDDSVRDVTTPSASLAVRPAVVAAPSRAVIGEGHVTTTGALPPATLCAPRPPNVSWAKPSHSSAGSNVSAPFGSPAWTVSLRRSVLSAVLVSPLPHSVPGSTPIWPTTSRTVDPLRSTIASSPLNHDVPEVWSATPRISGPALVARARTRPG